MHNLARCSLLLHVIATLPIPAHAEDGLPLKTRNVILVTYDGLRWQEVFGGADETLMSREHGGLRSDEDLAALRVRFDRDTLASRRAALLPFFWSVLARDGKVFGNPDQKSLARVSNGLNFSYPGYNELLSGRPDPRIKSNDKRPNPNVTVLEWLHTKEPFRGRVAAFSSWDTFPDIINAERSGVPVNAGWQPLEHGTDAAELRRLNALFSELPHNWDNVRYDYFTFRGAQEYLKVTRPRVLYVSLGETDDWAHAGRYDLYLDAAHRNDRYVRQLWETAQSLPDHAGTTSLILTTDHGRGDTRVEWKNHGADVPGADQMWIAVLGPDTPAGPPPEGTVMQSQVAATLAALLGEDFCAAIPAAALPLPGVVPTK